MNPFWQIVGYALGVIAVCGVLYTLWDASRIAEEYKDDEDPPIKL